MSRIFEEMQKEVAVQIARQLLEKGIAPDVISECTGLSLEAVMDLTREKSA